LINNRRRAPNALSFRYISPMTRTIYIIIAVAVAAILLVFLPVILPSGAGPAYLYLIVLGLDIYLWSSIRRSLSDLSHPMAVVMRILYWFPLAMLIGASVTMFFIHFSYWRPSIRIWVFGIIVLAYASKLIPVFLLILADLLRLVKFTWRFTSHQTMPVPTAKRGISRSRFLRYTGFLGGGIVFSSMLAGMVKWVYDFRIHRVKVPLSGLPSSFSGYRIVQISDLHLGSWSSDKPLQEAVGLINSLNPDLVVFTGDLVNYQTNEVDGFGDSLLDIQAPDGVVAILGNHDYGDYMMWDDEKDKTRNMDDLVGFYDKLGWRLLRNESLVISRGKDAMGIIGVENWGANLRFPRKGDLAAAQKHLPGTVAARVLLSHDPTHWQHIVSRRNPEIGLTLSGHTHGMQMGIETKQFRWSPAQYMYRYWAGLYRKEFTNQYLYVNRGLGHIGYPGRIGILPEITLLELVSAN